MLLLLSTLEYSKSYLEFGSPPVNSCEVYFSYSLIFSLVVSFSSISGGFMNFVIGIGATVEPLPSLNFKCLLLTKKTTEILSVAVTFYHAVSIVCPLTVTGNGCLIAPVQPNFYVRSVFSDRMSQFLIFHTNRIICSALMLFIPISYSACSTINSCLSSG